MRRQSRWVANAALGLFTALVAVLEPVASAVARPRRIVSLNLCLDPIVLELAGRPRIAALTTLSADPTLSTIAHEVGGIRLVRGSAEEVLALEPDLILAVDGVASATVDLLRRLGRPVVTIPLPWSIADIKATVERIADAVGEADKGRAMIARMERRLARVSGEGPAAGAVQTSALVVHVGGLVSRRGSFIDETVTRAGLRNAAEDHRLGRTGRLELEDIVTHPPDLLILGTDPDTYRTAVADNLRHPVLARMLRDRPNASVSAPDWLCGTPGIAAVVEQLARVRSVVEQTAKSGRGPSR